MKAGIIPPEADGPVRAMAMVLHLERDAPPRTAVLGAAAAAALAVCLDPRSEPGGEWHDAVAAWTAGRIRKIARRARGAHWAAVQDVPGVTWAVPVDGGSTVGPVGHSVGGVAGAVGHPVSADAGRAAAGAHSAGRPPVAQVRALVPGPVDEVPRVVSRLQIGGTDLPADDPGPVPDGAVAIYLNPGIAMSVGKAAAQVGHASMLWAAVRGARGIDAVPRFAVRLAARDRWAQLCAAVGRDEAVAVRDAGFTEVDPGTVTCVVDG
ncbi:MAG: peptidyl-tRNA hydrolase [Pseudonocardia sp.]